MYVKKQNILKDRMFGGGPADGDKTIRMRRHYKRPLMLMDEQHQFAL